MAKPTKPFMTGIRFPSKVYESIVIKTWGQELIFVNSPWFCSKLLIIKPGFQSSRHFHKTKRELFVCLDGFVTLELSGGNVEMQAGDRHLLNPLDEHRFSSLTGGIIYEISTQHLEDDVVRLTQSGRIDEEDQLLLKSDVSRSEQEVLLEPTAEGHIS